MEISLLAEVKAAARNLRQDADGNDSPMLLKTTDIPATKYEAGKIVMAPDSISSGDRLRMRGMPIIYLLGNKLRYSISGLGNTMNVVEDLASIRNNRSDLVAGLMITSAGLVVDMGGKGAEGTDFRAESFSLSSAEWLTVDPGTPGSGAGEGYDLTLEFGRPTASPEGSAEYFWTAALMPTPNLVEAATVAGFSLRNGDRTFPVGVYHVRLSNHIGVDKATEDPDEPYPNDDTNFYLSHAAYGFMDFFRPGVDLSSPFAEHGFHRIFPFHIGYDAFQDQAGMRTADIADEDRIINGKFKGRTIAVQFDNNGGLASLASGNVKRMRGDVELTATIGTSSDTITGKISNMEDWDPQGYWEPSTTITDDIEFSPDGRIDAKGEFTGTFGNYPTGFEHGGYRGNLYGPLGGLEAAGAWAVSPASGRSLSIAGSFGASLVRPDGSYGTAVPAGN